MRFFGKTTIDFMGKRKLWYTISGTIVLIGFLSPVIKGLHFGIDFLGGTELIIQFKQPADVGKIRGMMDNAGFLRSEIKAYGNPNTIVLRTEMQGEGNTVEDKITASLQQTFPDDNPKVIGK